MKKLITIILILALALPTLATAEDQDPIIGCWFYNMNAKELPTSANTQGILREIHILYFDVSGDVYAFLVDVKETGCESSASAVGKWEKTKNSYSVKIIGVGEVDAVIKNGELLISLHNPSLYTVYKRLSETDVYSMYVRK